MLTTPEEYAEKWRKVIEKGTGIFTLEDAFRECQNEVIEVCANRAEYLDPSRGAIIAKAIRKLKPKP